MSGFLADTNVFSKIFRGDLELSRSIVGLDSVIDATVYIECIQGSKSNHEKRVIDKYLQQFPLMPITPVTSALAIGLIREYSNTYGLLLADALIASTALDNKLTILTFNIKDFSFIRDLRCQNPLSETR